MSNIAVLCIHGFMGHPGEYKILKELFTNLGYDTYSFVLSGHQGHILKGATRKDWEQDCIDNIGLLKNKGYKGVIIVGHSMGGLLGAMMAVKNEDYIKKLILFDPAFEYLKMKDGRLKVIPSLKQVFKVLKEVLALKKAHYSPIKGCTLSSLKEFCLLVKESGHDIDKVKCPVLFLHGTNDCIVPIEQMKSIYEGIDNKHKEFVEVNQGSHWFLSSKQDDEIYDKIKEFLLDKKM